MHQVVDDNKHRHQFLNSQFQFNSSQDLIADIVTTRGTGLPGSV